MLSDLRPVSACCALTHKSMLTNSTKSLPTPSTPSSGRRDLLWAHAVALCVLPNVLTLFVVFQLLRCHHNHNQQTQHLDRLTGFGGQIEAGHLGLDAHLDVSECILGSRRWSAE